jgi:hypothetical protein
MRVLRWFLLVVLVLVVGFVVWALFINPAPTVTEQPKAPAARPSRPLQADAEGYYEPGYQFSVAGLRFTRLTLRPEAFVTFLRTGTRQEVGCLEAVIGSETVTLRCDIDRVGTLTVEGQFLSRFATTRLDTPVLSAFLTVRNQRGETLYRARDSFLWHPPE